MSPRPQHRSPGEAPPPAFARNLPGRQMQLVRGIQYENQILRQADVFQRRLRRPRPNAVSQSHTRTGVESKEYARQDGPRATAATWTESGPRSFISVSTFWMAGCRSSHSSRSTAMAWTSVGC